MNPLIAIAVSLLPEIVKAFGDDTANNITNAVTKAVTDITGTSDPAQAKQKVQQDPEVANDLKVKLAQIAADVESKKRQEEFAKQQALLADLDKARQEQIDNLQKQRQADLDELGKRIQDAANARSTFQALAESGSSFAWGAPVVSTVVTVGFFIMLGILIFHGFPKLAGDQGDGSRIQVLNVILGTLATAFTTVVTFWVGSAQSSRNKDDATFRLLSQQVQQTSDTLKSQAQTALEIAKRPDGPSGGGVGAGGLPPQDRNKTSNFNRCVDVILKWEGGFTQDPQDPGGATNLGITIGELEQWRDPKPVTVDDVKNLTKNEAMEIYRTNYWNKLRCDDLPAGIDLVVFDFGVNAGIGHSARMLQLVVGAAQDGSIGPATLAATKASDPTDVIKSMTEKRLAYYQGLSTWPHFGKGWTNRTNDVGQTALQMAAQGELVA